MNKQARKQQKKANQKQMNVLRSRSPNEWLALVNQVDKSIRPNIARLVWWDFFSYRNVAQRWNHLDDFLNIPYAQLFYERENPDKVVEPDHNLIFDALLMLGYPEDMAVTRI